MSTRMSDDPSITRDRGDVVLRFSREFALMGVILLFLCADLRLGLL